MTEYIEREAALALTHEIHIPEVDYRHRCIDPDALRELPAADVQPVRHGRWMPEDECKVTFHSKCSECGCFVSNFPEDAFLDCSQAWNYCPNCGAKMDKED